MQTWRFKSACQKNVVRKEIPEAVLFKTLNAKVDENSKPDHEKKTTGEM
jgi:hypothetical protein